MKRTSIDPVLFTVIFLIALVFIVAGPFIQMWAINTLFKTSIEYNWLNWACVMILNSSVGAVSYRGKS